jgi:hypothetical protein
MPIRRGCSGKNFNYRPLLVLGKKVLGKKKSRAKALLNKLANTLRRGVLLILFMAFEA